MKSTLASTTALVVLMSVGGAACSQEVYSSIGSSGLTLGLSYSMSPLIRVRGEISSGIKKTVDGRQGGVDFLGQFRSQTAGLFADFYPWSNGVKLVAGLSHAKTNFKLTASGKNSSTRIGSTANVNLAGEVFDVEIAFPKLMPYLGIGYVHNSSGGLGLEYFGEIGWQFGKPNTSVSTTLVSSGKVSAIDIETESKSIRESVSKLPGLPRASIGISYKF